MDAQPRRAGRSPTYNDMETPTPDQRQERHRPSSACSGELGGPEHETPTELLQHTDVIQRLCELQGEVSRHIGYDEPADCFCGRGGFWDITDYDPARDYRNAGVALAYIEAAVREKIERENADAGEAA